jgi:hypothetical protein
MNTPTTPQVKELNAGQVEFVRRKLAELRTLRGEIRVKMNLAGKEARERWRRLEAQARAVEAHARGGHPTSGPSLAKLVDELKRFKNRLVEKAAPILRIC